MHHIPLGSVLRILVTLSKDKFVDNSTSHLTVSAVYSLNCLFDWFDALKLSQQLW